MNTVPVIAIDGPSASGKGTVAARVAAALGFHLLDSGALYVRGKPVEIKSPRQAIAQGIALVTEDRKTQGLVLEASIAGNTTLANLKAVTDRGFINRKKENEVARDYIRQLKTKAPGEGTSCMTLSGGNQQKVVLAKWLYTQADILILDEPTRGIDVGAKYEIYQLIHKFVGEGKSVIMISSEMPEVLNMSDRVIVIHEGNQKGELTKEEMTAENVMKLAILTEE